MQDFIEDLKASVQPDVVAELLQEYGAETLRYKILTIRLLSTTTKTERDKTTANAVMFLSPATETSKQTLCPWSTQACREACLIYSGRLRTRLVRHARMFRTMLFLSQPDLFQTRLIDEITKHEAKAIHQGKIPVVRFNGTTDLQEHRVFRNIPQVSLFSKIPRMFPRVQFVEYTKNPKQDPRAQNQVLTLSYSGSNQAHAIQHLSQGRNVAVVFDGPLPETWLGYPVVSGDTHDNRFKDPQTGVIVGLQLKGTSRAKDQARLGKFAVAVNTS